MLRINIICMGTLKEKFFTDAVKEYSKRMSTLCNFNVIELPECRLSDSPPQKEIDSALLKEGEAILSHCRKNAKIIAMCIEGKQLSSPALAEKFNEYALCGTSEICFVIGSSFGLCDKVKNASDFKLSMSEMTFPHQLARVMLCEQIYRALMINRGSKYHK